MKATKSIFKLVVSTFINWLETQYPSAGKPTLHTLEAEANVVIGALPDRKEDLDPDLMSSLPSVEDVPSPITEEKIKAIMQWVFTSMLKSTKGLEWAPLAIYSHWYLAKRNAGEILKRIVLPAKPLDSGHELPSLPPR